MEDKKTDPDYPYRSKTHAEQTEEVRVLRQHYRNTFSTTSGKIVFKDLLINEFNAFGDEIEEGDEDARVRRNVGNMLLERLGCGDEPAKTVDAIVDTVLTLPITIQGIDKT